MNIDILISSQGEIGLVCDGGFESPVAGIMFDAQTHMLSLEFADMNALDMNIPVEDSIRNILLYRVSLQVGIIEHDQIQDTRSVPLVLINDPLSGPGGQAQYQQPTKPYVSVTAFERFLKNCVSGQPVHRDDLGNEDSADGVMAGVNTAIVQFAPHLARQKTMEAIPTLTPNVPGLSMGGGGGRTSYSPPRQQGGQAGEQGRDQQGHGHPRRGTSEDDER